MHCSGCIMPLERSLTGRVAVKISTGEPGGHNFLQPSLIRGLVEELQGTIVECNTAYAGRRNTTGGALEGHCRAWFPGHRPL